MKPLLVLAGGFGTRLRAVVNNVPKPLAPVNKLPFISYLIENWVKQGVKEFIFLLHYEAEQIILELNKLSKKVEYSGIIFRTVIEAKPLGTGGSILNALTAFNIKGGFLVSNADTWLQGGIKSLSRKHTPFIAGVQVQDAGRYGSLTFEGNKIKSFQEKGKFKKSMIVNSGLYHLVPEVFDGFKLGLEFSLEDEVFPSLVKSGNLRLIHLRGDFIDIGVPEDYFNFCKKFS